MFDMQQSQSRDFVIDSEGILRLGTRLCVPDVDELREEIMKTHFSTSSIHPGSTKMYHDLKDTYWWNGMKRDIADFMSKCLTCQQVKWNIRGLRIIATVTYSRVEVGQDCHGFCKWFSSYIEWL